MSKNTSQIQEQKELIFHCQKCDLTPLIAINSINTKNNEINIVEKCLNRHEIKTPLSKYNFTRINNHTCDRCNHTQKNKEEDFFYCTKCIKFYCINCKEIHFNNHNNQFKKNNINKNFLNENTYLIPVSNLNCTCLVHNEKIVAYCYKCQKGFCIYCSDSHINHCKVNLIDLKIKINEIEDKIKKAEELNEYNKRMCEDTLKNLMIEIEKFKKSSIEFYKINCKEIELSKYILENYKQNEKKRNLSFEIIQDIKTITNFNINKITDNPGENLFEKIGRIYEYLKNPENYLIKDMKFNFNDELFIDRTKYKTIKAHNDSVQCVICLNDGRLASSSNDSSIKIYELNTFKCQITIKEHQDSVFYLTQLKNGNLVSSSEDSTIKIFKLLPNLKYNLIQTLNGHLSAVMKTIELSNLKLMSCSTDEKIKIWSKKKKNNLYECETTISDDEKIYSIIEIPNLNEFISSEGESVIKFYNLNTYDKIYTFNDLECSGWTYSLCMINKDYLSVGGNGIIYLIRLSTHNIIKTINTENKIICIYKIRDDSILTGDLYGKIRQWKFNYGDLIPIEDEVSAHKEKIPTIVQLFDGIIVTGSYDCKIKLWK